MFRLWRGECEQCEVPVLLHLLPFKITRDSLAILSWQQNTNRNDKPQINQWRHQTRRLPGRRLIISSSSKTCLFSLFFCPILVSTIGPMLSGCCQSFYSVHFAELQRTNFLWWKRMYRSSFKLIPYNWNTPYTIQYTDSFYKIKSY